MQPIITVRRYEDKDLRQMQEVIRNSVLSKFSSAFWFCLFREITLQMIVLSTAIFFIFFGVPLLYCVSSVPIVVLLIAICVYCAHYNKAIELSNMHAPICFVAELYEPFAMRIDKRELEYIQMTEEQLKQNEGELRKMRGKQIIGTISTRNHQSLHESAWIYRLAVDPSYSFVQTAKPLIIAAMQHAFENGMLSCETTCAECHEDPRELFLKIGFNIRQIYHKSIIGSSLRVMKAQLGIDLRKYFKSQQNNKSRLDSQYE
ncbi:hypothetical protein PVAND_015756 [Polypedilum vanderplanki]|uniref:N-acetyltransferase domain-containing protein n=1 Tax=Polypedilum vanderplanki TaxID=319348 RepID=A0A9J6BDJ8_POLVA|nr:hypothetical protein PVAND_015756 [Polypedilum vanderplanki]